MKLKYIVLEGCKRLLAAGTKSFEFNPESNEIVIIGTNGTGKSTILKHWTPLPPANKEFVKGGKKETHWDHRGSEYKIISLYLGANSSHTFIKDDEVIIENGTASVLTQKISEYFNIDKDIHDLMTGKKKLSTMSVLERREWIMRISGGDFNFVMELFDDISVKLRDNVGAIKHSRMRLIELEKDRVDPETLLKYKNNLDQVNSTIGLVVDIKGKINTIGDVTSTKTLDNVLKSYSVKYDGLLSSLESTITGLKAYSVDRYSFVDNTPVLRSEAVIHKQHLNAMLEELTKIKEQELLSKEVDSLEGLKNKVNFLKSKLDNLSGFEKDYFYDDLKDPKSLLSTFNLIHLSFNTILSSWSFIPYNNLLKNKNEISNSIISISEKINILEKKLVEFQHEMQHIRMTNSSECPKCSHRWKPGLSPEREAQLNHEISRIDEIIKIKKNELSYLNEDLESVNNKIGNYNDYLALCRNTPNLHTLWVLINDSKCLTDRSVSIKSLIDKWAFNVELKDKENDLLNEIQILNDKIGFIESIHLSISNPQLHKERLESRIQDQYTLINTVENKINETSIINKLIDKIKTIENEVKTDITDIEQIVKDIVARESLNIFEEVNSKLNKDSYQINSLLMRSESCHAVLSDLELSLSNLVEANNAYLVLVSELSPKEGFVADLLSSFITQMLLDMNNVLGSIWTHDIEILPCLKGGSFLDFKFPLAIKGNDPADDIADGSSAQVDVVDFAFKYVVSQYLGLMDYPFLLDELAPTFDECHRRNILHFIRHLADTGICSQLVMISHYSEIHSSFVKAEYLVTDTSNVTIPNLYNINATFTN